MADRWDQYADKWDKYADAPPASSDPNTNAANTALAGTGLSVSPPNPIAGTTPPAGSKARRPDRPDLALAGPSTPAPSAIPPRGFFGSAIDQLNPIPAIKDYLTKGPSFVQGLNSARSPESMPFPAGQGPGSDILGQVAQPAQTAGRQVAEGNYLGAAGTLVGGYGVPAAMPKVVKAAPYAPAYAREALAGAAEGAAGQKWSWPGAHAGGVVGGGTGAIFGGPRGWVVGHAIGEVAGGSIPRAIGAVKGAVKATGELRTALADQAAPPPVVPVIPPRTSLADRAGIQPSAVPPRSPVEPIPSEGLPSGRQVGGSWNEPPEPPLVLPREAPAWKTQGIEPSETTISEVKPITGQLPSGRKVGSAIPPSVRTTGKVEPPPATTPVPEQVQAQAPTELETQLQQSIDAVKSGKPIESPYIDPEIEAIKAQQRETYSTLARGKKVDATYNSLKDQITSEQADAFSPEQWAAKFEQAGQLTPSAESIKSIREKFGLSPTISKPVRSYTKEARPRQRSIPKRSD